MNKFIWSFGLAVLATPLAAQTPEQVAEAALRAAPVWDGHNDVPIQLRARFGNVLEDFDFADTGEVVDEDGQHMHTDLARLAEGRVGAQSGRSTSRPRCPSPRRSSPPSSRSTLPSG